MLEWLEILKKAVISGYVVEILFCFLAALLFFTFAGCMIAFFFQKKRNQELLKKKRQTEIHYRYVKKYIEETKRSWIIFRGGVALKI